MHIWESRFFRTTTTYLLLGKDCLLIDPNFTDEELAFIRSFVHSRHEEADVHLFFTHADFDHIPGFAYFLNARTYGSRLFRDADIRKKAIAEWKQFDREQCLTRKYGYPFPDPGVSFSKERENYRIDGHEIRVIPAPGHTADSCLVLVPEMGICLAGDYLSNIEIPFIEHDVHAYRETLRQLHRLVKKGEIKYLVPGHGDIALAPTDMEKRIIFADAYLSELIKPDTVSDDEIEMQWGRRYPPIQNVRSFHRHNRAFLEKQVGNVL